MLVYISSCWLSPDHNNTGLSHFCSHHPILPQLTPYCAEGSEPLSSPLLSLKLKLGGAGGDTIVSGRLSVSSTNSSSNTGGSCRRMTVDTLPSTKVEMEKADSDSAP